jgi:predicted permease
MTLLVGAGLLIRSFMSLSSVDPGFSTESVVTFQVTASRDRFVDEPGFGAGVPYFEELADGLKQAADVEAAGYGSQLFLFSSGASVGLELPGRPDRRVTVGLLHVSPGYLRALGIRVLQGRRLSESDDPSAPMVMLVNRAFVRQHVSGREPIGLRVLLSVGGSDADVEIVGVVGDVRRGGLATEPYPQVFLPYTQAGAWGAIDSRSALFVVRTTRSEAFMASVADAVHGLDAGARVERVMPLDAVVAESIAAPRFFGTLLTIFAGIGLILASVGLFGVVSHAVARRTKEIGIRLALGADRADVLSLVLRRALALTSVGIALGVLGASGGSRHLESMLFGIEPADPWTFGLASLALFLVAVLAALVPARRAMRVDPLLSLRQD